MMTFKNEVSGFVFSRNMKWLVSTFLIATLVFGISHVLPTLAQTATASRVSEILNIPFTSYDAVMTTKNYTGEVLVIVSGMGQASGLDYTDAFYAFTSGGILLETPVSANEFGLEIDGNRAVDIVEILPEYAPDHIYVFLYDVGSNKPRPVAFRVAETGLQDNTGAFTVRIVPLSKG